MIEGLRVLPWWHEAIRRNLIGERSDCKTCMDQLPADQRQLQGCGFLPPPPAHLLPFVRPSAPLGCEADATVCPGYSTGLPETIEIARARLHWSKGSLREFCAGQPPETLIMGIEILEGATNECQNWCAENPRKKGGA